MSVCGLGETRNQGTDTKFCIGKPLEKRLLAKPIGRLEVNAKVGLREVACVLRIGDGWNSRHCPTSGSATDRQGPSFI